MPLSFKAQKSLITFPNSIQIKIISRAIKMLTESESIEKEFLEREIVEISVQVSDFLCFVIIFILLCFSRLTKGIFLETSKPVAEDSAS